MIEVRNLCKRYGDHLAVDNLSFVVKEGQIYGFLGPNGAGKSTTMNIITGCLAATSGEVLIDGHDIYKDARKAKAQIGYLPEIPPLYPDMTPREYLDFVAQMKGIQKKQRAQSVQSVMEKTGLLDVQNRLIKNLSKGYKQRVGLAQAILGDPKVIILDEPTVGLDPAQIVEIRGLIKSLAETHTVIFSSHILSEVSEICSQILIISGGKLVAEDTPQALESRFVTKPVLSVLVKGEADTVRAALEPVEGIEAVEAAGNDDGTVGVTITCAEGVDLKEAVSRAVSESGGLILRLEESRASLEDVFMELISQPDNEQVAPQEAQPQVEMDAEALLNGTMPSAYDAHEAFNTAASTPAEESAETEEPDAETQEGGDSDDGNV